MSQQVSQFFRPNALQNTLATISELLGRHG
jgi:hypothetical protein